MGPSSASRVFGSVLKRHGIDKEVREHRLLLQWASVVGPRVADRTLPDRLEKGVLWVRVESSTWMHQLNFMKEDIIAKANDLCGEEVVKDLHFHLGRHSRKANDPLSAAVRIRRPPLPARPLPAPARGPALRAIEDEAAAVADDELREAIIDVRRRLNL
ncbi:MAG: DUF721 domain-containing protein [Myxococcales bacterium]|nr:DUF721 domain-containing protein [Myxococcales bacterium]